MDNERESPMGSPLESPLERPIQLESDDEVNDNVPQTQPAAETQAQAQAPPTKKPNLTGKRQRKLYSTVWDHFEMIDDLDVHGNIQCKCIKCGTKYIAESSHRTGNMRRHMKGCKGKVYRDIGQMILQSNASGSVENRVCTFKVDEFRELLALAIARHNLPLQFVEYEGIRAVFSYLCPEVKHVSRHTIKNDVMKIYAKEKAKLNESLKRAPGRIAVTSDCWTSITTDGYISLTAHFIDKNWRLAKRVLAFSFIPPPHTGAALAEKMTCMLKEWGIEKRIASVTLDNASANDSMVETLKYDLDLVSNGDYFHVRCCSHILNLIVQEGLKEIDEAILKVRESVKYCKGSQSRRQKFLKCVQHVNLEGLRGLRQDVPTRWNSTYTMLESALFFKKALLHMKATDANFVSCPNSEEWGRIERICKFLSVFHEVTLAFSGTKYPTSNLYFPNVIKVRLLLKEHMGGSDRFLKAMATKMWEKFDKYWSEFSTIMAIAVVFDPRFKLQVVEWAYKKLHDERWEFEMELFKAKLFALYNEYASSTPSSSNRQGNGQSSPTHVDQTSDTYMEDFDDYEGTSISSAEKSDLQLYLEEQKLPRTTNINVLDHWKGLQGRYPIASLMARDILAIPISTVASESTFSIGGRVLDAYRSSLNPNTAEALICVRDWVFQKDSTGDEISVLCNQVAGMSVEIVDDDDDQSSKNMSEAI